MILKPVKYNFNLPKELIAKEPAIPRDKARLLIYSKGENRIRWGIFWDIGDYLPKNSVLVFNKTRVIPARIFLTKETGGKVEILYLEERNGLVKALADRGLNLGSTLFFRSKRVFRVERQNKNVYWLKSDLKNVQNFLEKHGQMPIPPYIKNTPLSSKKLKEKYQTVFADKPGSCAAPTASLHFTNRLLNKLKKKGFKIRFVTLHVGLGTFAPLTEKNLRTGRLHKEYYELDRMTYSFLKKAKKEGKPIIAVGTTVARALEAGKIKGETDLFIQEGYKFKMIDGLITNFHLPGSSLLMLVSAFAGRENILKCYRRAVKKNLKFYSFGDGMLII